MLDGMLEAIAQMLPEGWSNYDEEMGFDFLLECPHGNVIEQDGSGPCGCVSPLRTLGIV